jgi:hypothetical protein
MNRGCWIFDDDDHDDRINTNIQPIQFAHKNRLFPHSRNNESNEAMEDQKDVMEDQRHWDYKWGFVLQDVADPDNADQTVVVIHKLTLQAAQRAREYYFRQDARLQLVSINDASCVGMRAEELVDNLVCCHGQLLVVVKALGTDSELFTMVLDDSSTGTRIKSTVSGDSHGVWRPWRFLRSSFSHSHVGRY